MDYFRYLRHYRVSLSYDLTLFQIFRWVIRTQPISVLKLFLLYLPTISKLILKIQRIFKKISALVSKKGQMNKFTLLY